MQYREREVVEMAASASFVAFITVGSFGDRRPAAEVMAVRDQIPSLEAVVTFGDPSEDSGTADMHWEPRPATDDEVQRVAAAVAADPGDPNDAATICWTSGTEGNRRVCAGPTTTGSASPGADRRSGHHRRRHPVEPVPDDQHGGINGMLLPWLLQGATLVQHHPFDPQTFFMQIAVERPTYTLVPPALLWQLLNNEELLAKVDLSSLTRVGSGSAPLQLAMVRGWQQKMGLSVINFFGSNEGVALLSSPEDFPDPTNARFFPATGRREWNGPDGLPSACRSSSSTWRAAPRSPNPGSPVNCASADRACSPVTLHADQLASPFDDEGCFARRHVRDRRRPQPVPALRRPVQGPRDPRWDEHRPAEVEALISEHPAVAEVAVVGYADEQMGERVAAVVVPRPGPSSPSRSSTSSCGPRRLLLQAPEHLEIRDVLPRNEVGKILARAAQVSGKETSQFAGTFTSTTQSGPRRVGCAVVAAPWRRCRRTNCSAGCCAPWPIVALTPSAWRT